MREFARLAGISNPYLSQIEHAGRLMPVTEYGLG